MRINAHDVLLRLLSVLLALLLWFVVAGQKNAEISVAAPIEFRNVPAGLELVGPVPRTVEIWLRGSPGMIQRLRPSEVYVPLDSPAPRRLACGAPGQRRDPHPLRGTDCRHPAGVLRPGAGAQHQANDRRQADAGRRRGARLPRGGRYALPTEVTIAGPESRITALDGVPTEPVSVEKAQMNVVREVSLLPPDAPLWLVDPHPIRVTVRVERETEAKN